MILSFVISCLECCLPIYFLRFRLLCLSLTSSGGRVLLACANARVPWRLLRKPAPPTLPSLLPPSLARKSHSRNIYRTPTASRHRAGPPGAPLRASRSTRLPPPSQPVRNPESLVPRLRHGIRGLLPRASPHLLSQRRLMIGGSVRHSIALPPPRGPAPGPRRPLPCAPAPAPLLWLIAGRRAPRSSGQSTQNWPRAGGARQPAPEKGPERDAAGAQRGSGPVCPRVAIPALDSCGRWESCQLHVAGGPEKPGCLLPGRCANPRARHWGTRECLRLHSAQVLGFPLGCPKCFLNTLDES